MTIAAWPANRAEGLARLAAFVPAAGRDYSAQRNFDRGAGRHTAVSVLSPYIRHRLITESEVVQAVLQTHSPAAAEKFVQEVCWRTYWKGWLEQHSQVWDEYLIAVETGRRRLRVDDALAAEIAAAERGDIGLACFDAWAQELVATGYLHNHARMWFASIWIFTLRLPWALGADFFYRHLLDGDPASNTLSWRWVGGLQTRGKTYLARPDNIAKYTEGRLTPDASELAAFAAPLDDGPPPLRQPLPAPDVLSGATPAVLVVTEDDLSPETWPLGATDINGIVVIAPEDNGPALSSVVRMFQESAADDCCARAAKHWNVPAVRVSTVEDVIAFARGQKAECAVTTIAPVGYAKPFVDALAAECARTGLPLRKIARRWDTAFWPHAKAGFFQLKDRIPTVLDKLDLMPRGSDR